MLREGASFCTGCGVRMQAAPTPPPSVSVDAAPDVADARVERSFRPRSVVAVIGAAVVLGAAAMLLTRGPEPVSSEPRALAGQPRELSDIEVDGEATAVGRLGDLAILVVYGTDPAESGSVVAVDLSTGNDIWEEDGSAAAVVDGRIVIGFEDELQRFDSEGRAVGASLRVGGEIGRVSVAGRRLFVETDAGTTLVDTARWGVVSDEVGRVSFDLGQVAEVDPRDDEFRVQRVDPVTGDRIGSEVYIDADVDDFELLDDGRIAVLDDDDVAILDASGNQVASVNGPRDSIQLVVGPQSTLMVLASEDSTVYRVSGNEIRELGPDVDGFPMFLAIDDSVFLVANAGGEDIEVHQVTNGDVRRIFEVSGSSWFSTASGIYVLDDEQLDYYTIPGDGRSSWSVDRDDEERFVVVDRLVVRVEYDSISESTKLTFLG